MAYKITTNPYKSDQYILKKYNDNCFRLIWLPKVREQGWELCSDTQNNEHVLSGDFESEKRNNNLSRLRSLVREYGLCNDWEYWGTFTIDKAKRDRYDFQTIQSDLSDFIHNYNKRCNDKEKVVYLYIPEFHKDGAIHFHFLLKGIRKKDLIKNEHGYLTWVQYNEKFGFINIESIRDINRVSNYIIKYITKDLCDFKEFLGKHLVFHSKGLNTAKTIYKGSGLFNDDWNYINPDGYCKIKDFYSLQDLKESGFIPFEEQEIEL